MIFSLFVTVIFIIGLYFLPTFIAIGRKHQSSLQIALLNALLGWLIIGWVVALIWATTKNVDPNASTKGAWIVIAIMIIPTLLSLFFYNVLRFNHANNQEPYYKKVDYSYIIRYIN